jgi:hypothetical protein
MLHVFCGSPRCRFGRHVILTPEGAEQPVSSAARTSEIAHLRHVDVAERLELATPGIALARRAVKSLHAPQPRAIEVVSADTLIIASRIGRAIPRPDPRPREVQFGALRCRDLFGVGRVQ